MSDWEFSECFLLKFAIKKTPDPRTHGRTDGWTDKASYRDAWTHLKRLKQLSDPPKRIVVQAQRPFRPKEPLGLKVLQVLKVRKGELGKGMQEGQY